MFEFHLISIYLYGILDEIKITKSQFPCCPVIVILNLNH